MVLGREVIAEDLFPCTGKREEEDYCKTFHDLKHFVSLMILMGKMDMWLMLN